MTTAVDCSVEARTVPARRSSPPRTLPRDLVRDWLPLTDTHLREKKIVPTLSIDTAVHAGGYSDSPASTGGESEAKGARATPASATPSADSAEHTSTDTGDPYPTSTASPLRISSGLVQSYPSPKPLVSSAFGPSPVFPSPSSKPRSREQQSSLSPVAGVSRVVSNSSTETRTPASSRPATPSLLSPPSPAASGRLHVSAKSPVLVDEDSSSSSGRQRPSPPAFSRSEPATAISREARPTLPRSFSHSAVPTSSPSPEGKGNRVSTLFKRGLFGRSKPEQQPKGGSSPMQPRSPVTHLRGTETPAAYRLTPTLSLTTFPSGRWQARSESPQPLPTHSPSLRSVSPICQSYVDHQPLETARTWKSLLDNDAIVYLTLQHGHDEMHRQEIVFEIIETERAFVESMRAVVDIYGQSIRAGRIEGVPRSVARLFSRLEGILDLHSRLSSTLAVAADTQNAGRLVMHFADLFAPYVSEFEVYQAYLLRFEAVTAVLDLEIAAGTSPFATFLREHALRPGAGGMSLSSFLLKPIQRLMKYPLFFARLSDVTGPSHPDYAATSDLSDEMDEMIRALQDVKMREEEYEAMKVLEGSLVGLPDDFKLAERSRTLIFEGTVRHLHVGDRERAALDLLHSSSAGPRHSLRARAPSETYISSTLAAPPRPAAVPRRTSDRAVVTTKARPVSTASDSNASTTASSASCSVSTASDSNASVGATTQTSASQSSSVGTTPPGSPESPKAKIKSLRAPPAATPPGTSKRNSLVSSPASAVLPLPSQSPSLPPTSKLRLRAKESSLHVWVFSDVVILARRDDPGRLTKSDRALPALHRRVLDHVGVARLRGFEDMSNKTDYDNLLEINVDSWSSRSQGPTHRASFYVVPPLRLKPKSGRPSSASSTFSRSSTMTSFSSKLSASTNSAATVMPDVDLATFGKLYAALGNAQIGIDPPETAPSLGTDYWISRVRRVKADMRARRHGLA
ncbi:hypothetical protein C6P46_001202 [Rhodotorula mucilaginosa]|uniref:DH domain-containing protein n=1 Tax=Rhodotorula mucilaginosa TaxID=5537 RepID=A0A9P6W7B9_RHOMI|nr:hypothetical protein C6P46_001202 [Rhodotorula mucilaginosa]